MKYLALNGEAMTEEMMRGYKSIASGQIVGTCPRWACYRDLYQDDFGNRISVRIGSDFELKKNNTK